MTELEIAIQALEDAERLLVEITRINRGYGHQEKCPCVHCLYRAKVARHFRKRKQLLKV